MSINKIYSDQSRRVDWTVREDTDATLTLTVTQSNVAYDLSSTTFIAEFFEVGSSTAFLTLTQGSGLTNGGAAGTLTIALTDTQLNLTPNQYFWKLRTTAPTDYLWLNGIFTVNGYVWDGGTDYSVSVALTVANNNINIDLLANGGAGGGSGTVTSFSAGNLTPLFTSSVANSTTTPALSFSQIAKNANTVLAGPTTGSAANPDFRALVAADIPDISATYQPLDSDLTAIAALTTTSYGRALLTLANAAAADFLVKSSNLSDLANAATARTNLGVTATGADTTYAFRANNLSDLASASTARTNLGLGSLAVENTSYVVGLQDLYIPAVAMWPRSTSGCAALARTEIATSLVNIQTLDFDQTTQEHAQFTISLPKNWNNGTVTAKFYWTAASGSGTVTWGIQGGAYSDDDALTTALGSAQTVTDTLITANDLHISSATSAITLAGTPADSDFLAFQIYRDISDTLSADAKLLGVVIQLTTDAAVSA